MTGDGKGEYGERHACDEVAATLSPMLEGASHGHIPTLCCYVEACEAMIIESSVGSMGCGLRSAQYVPRWIGSLYSSPGVHVCHAGVACPPPRSAVWPIPTLCLPTRRRDGTEILYIEVC